MKNKPQPTRLPIPQDLAACQALIQELFTTIAQQQESLVEKERQLVEKQARIEQLVQERFRRRSERYKAAPNQMVLDFPGVPGIESMAEGLADAVVEEVEASETVTAKIAKPRKPRQRRQETLPEDLPRREIVVEGPESVRTCPTHGERVRIGEDVTETLVLIPAELYVERRVFPKYACANHAECGVGSPARPASLIEGNRYDTSIAAEIITAKYGFHLPVYRQQDLFAASGWAPARETLLNIMRSAAELLPPFISYLKRRVLADPYLGTDDTTVTLLLPRNLPLIDPDNPRSARIHEVLQAAREAGHPSVTARMWVSAIQRHMPRGSGAGSRRRSGAPDPASLSVPVRRLSRSPARAPAPLPAGLRRPTDRRPGPPTAGHSSTRRSGSPRRCASRIAFAVARSCRSSWRYRRIASGCWPAQTSGASAA